MAPTETLRDRNEFINSSVLREEKSWLKTIDGKFYFLDQRKWAYITFYVKS
jgi:hypothetical protein